MASTTAPLPPLERRHDVSGGFITTRRTTASAVSWGAVIAGAAAAAALSLVLLILGVGLGLSSVSPWSYEGVSATTFGVSTIVWLTFTQLLASGMGGYLAGRLRTKWMDTPADEVYFRDTAHGFLAWAVASLATAALLTSVVGSVVSGGAKVGAAAVGGVASTATLATAVAGGTAASGEASGASGAGSGAMGYFVDSLFRRNPGSEMSNPGNPADSTMPAGTADRASAPPVVEVGRIFLNARNAETLPPGDLQYVGQLVAQRTGLSQQDAERRVAEVHARARTELREAEVAAKQAADTARKASAYAALWIFISLLSGAFVASLAATFGGRQRDA